MTLRPRLAHLGSVFAQPSQAFVIFAERLASLGLAAVLTAATLFALAAKGETTSALERLRVADAIDNAYGEARYQVGAEESLERKYRLEPSAAIRTAHRRVGAALEATLVDARRLEAPSQRQALDATVAQQRRYMTATLEMFAAVDAGDTNLATRIDHERLDPVFDAVEHDVFARATAGRRVAADNVARLQDLNRIIVTGSVLLALSSLACFGLYAWVLRSYKRRLVDSHRHELERFAVAAMTDYLTETGNHRAFKDAIAGHLRRARAEGADLALALVDVDAMKEINDRSGHLHGDGALQTIGRLMRSLRFRDETFRVGGDEFAVILPHTSQLAAEALMERLRADVERFAGGATISVGIAGLRASDHDSETLQGRADAALYAAKHKGRNAVVGFDESVEAQWELAPTKIRSLRAVIDGGEMAIVLQPIWDIETTSILAYEALARPSPASGFAGPQELFDLADRVGRAHELDAVARRAALARAAVLPADASLFINMSPASLERDRFDPEAFEADVIAAGLVPERIVIEITERSVARVDAIAAVVTELQSRGFRIALDDTGAGNAGLEMLGALHVDFVKIDRSIIAKAATDRRARGIIAGIVAIAREIDAYVIAEGIEDRAMLEFVCATVDARVAEGLAIRGAQGYLLLRPSPEIATPGDAATIRALLSEVVRRVVATPS